MSSTSGSSVLSTIASAIGAFFGPSAGTAPGTVNATDLVKSAVIPAAIYGLSVFMPFVHVPAAVLIGGFALDLLRRIPHSSVPGIDTAVPAASSASAAPATEEPATIPLPGASS